MYSRRKKSTFLPNHFINEDLSISLGSEFNIDDFYQDFYHTGEYFLIHGNKYPDSDIYRNTRNLF